MPRQIRDIKHFLQLALRKEANAVTIKESGPKTKFKIKCTRCLYTLVLRNRERAQKLQDTLPPALKVTVVKAKRNKYKRKKGATKKN